MRAKLIYEKFKEESDPIKDMGIGALNVFVIEVDYKDEEWQTNPGVDIVLAHTKEQARKIWVANHHKHYYDAENPTITKISQIKFDKPNFYHILDVGVE